MLAGPVADLANLGTDAPGDDARVITIPANQTAEILLIPIGKQAAVVVGSLAAYPAIECFIDHQDSHLVAKAQQFRRGHVVGGTNRVTAHLLEDFELPLQRADIDGRSER